MANKTEASQDEGGIFVFNQKLKKELLVFSDGCSVNVGAVDDWVRKTNRREANRRPSDPQQEPTENTPSTS